MELDTDRLKGSESTTKPRRRSATPCWKDSKKYLDRDSLTRIGGDENIIIAYDEIAKEDHSYNATRGKRSRNENSWRLVLEAECANVPLDQRDDYKEAKETCNRLHKEHAGTAGCGNTTIHPQQQVRKRPNQQFEGYEEDSYRLDSSTGWKYYVPTTRNSSSSSSSWWQPSDSWWAAWKWESSSWSGQ